MRLPETLAASLRRSEAERIVPPTGLTAQLTAFAAGAMAFLCVFALALLFATDRVADRWADELARTATVRISAPPEQMDQQIAIVLSVLEQTSGVASGRLLDDGEQRALLEPWLGPDLPLDALPIPRLIEIIETDAGFDTEGLRLRLQAEAPGAVLDDHTRWRRPLIAAADSLRRLGWLSVILIGGVMASIVTLAASASLSANGKVIEVLRLIGARDRFVAHAFVRRFTLRTLSGAAVGAVLAMLALTILPRDAAPGFLTGIGFQGAEWFVPLLVPPAAAIVAFFATRFAALAKLREMR